MVGKTNWKPLELPLPSKIINVQHNCILGGTAEMSATVKVWTDAGEMIPTTLPFHSPVWLRQKSNAS